jgi:hypothetical protein
MNVSRSTVASMFMISLVLGGCTTPTTSFLGGSYPSMSYNQLKKRDVPVPLKLTVEFQRNGEHFPKGDVPLGDYATKVLKDSGVVTPVEGREEGEIRVVLNNVADLDMVSAERSGTRLPLWMAGTTITDAYELSMFITIKGKTIGRTGIKQSVHTALGNVRIPYEIKTFPHNQAFGKVLEQMMLRALLDMQKTGELALSTLPGRSVGIDEGAERMGQEQPLPRPRLLALPVS